MNVRPIPIGSTIRLRGDQLTVEGVLTRIEDGGIGISSPAASDPVLIPWERIQTIAQHVRTPREWGGILGFALLGGLVFGRIGWMLESLNDSGVRQPGAMDTGAALGALLGALVASVIAFAKPSRHWALVYAAPEGVSAGAGAVPLAQRLQEGARGAGARASSFRRGRLRQTGIAWVLLVLFLVGLIAFANSALNRVDFR